MIDISFAILFCLALVAFVAGVTGYNIGKRRYIHKDLSINKAGTIVINTTDPKKDVMRIELEEPIGKIIEGDHVVFVVRNEDKDGVEG